MNVYNKKIINFKGYTYKLIYRITVLAVLAMFFSSGNWAGFRDKASSFCMPERVPKNALFELGVKVHRFFK